MDGVAVGVPNTDLLEVDCDPKIPDDDEDVGAVEEPNIDLLDVDCDFINVLLSPVQLKTK